MRTAETNLLIAVRNQLRTELELEETECQIEFDEMAPAVVGNRYFAVVPGGWSPGPRHRWSGGTGQVNDLLYAVDVVVVKRIGHVPRDRRRDVFLGNLGNLNDEVDQVYAAIDWSYTVTTAANTLILAEGGTGKEFIKPLQFVSVERRPRLAPAELFAAQGQQAGMMRTISFGGAELIERKI